MDNLKYWEKLEKPPDWALKKITGGRLSGKTDINPQWRYHALTEQFGPCGIGWKFTIDEIWPVDANDGQVFAFAKVSLYIKNGEWSEPIPGIGGSMLIEKEKAGLHASDEGYKMAVTDALSTACKMIGVAADVYMGLFDGSKYRDKKPPPEKPKSSKLESTTKNFSFLQAMGDFKKDLNSLTGSDEMYYNILGGSGYQKSNEIKDRNEHIAVYRAMEAKIKELKANETA